MDGNGDCSTRQDWCDEENNKDDLPLNNRDRVRQKDEKFRRNGTHYGQAKEQLEEELTRLALVTSENRLLLREMQTRVQEADDELRLALMLLRESLQQNHNDSMLREEVINWEVMKQRIVGTLTDLGECQERVKTMKFTNLTQLFRILIQKSKGREKTVPSSKMCYYCLEEGHVKKECPHKKNKEMWKLTQGFKRKAAFRYEQKVDEMRRVNSVPWTGEGSEDENVITAGQNGRDNTRVNYNPLN